MNALANRLQANPSLEIGQREVVTFQQSNLIEWAKVDSQEMPSISWKNKYRTAWPKQSLFTAILLTYQINSISDDTEHKTFVYHEIKVAADNLNFNPATFINPFISAKFGRISIAPKIERKITEAPIWLMERMKTLQQRPSPTLQTVREQWAASMEFSKKLGDRLPV